jgi:hypothetical protein
VQFFKDTWGRCLRNDYFERIKTDLPQATDAQCFRCAFQMYVESLPHRRAARKAVDLPKLANRSRHGFVPAHLGAL